MAAPAAAPGVEAEAAAAAPETPAQKATRDQGAQELPEAAEAPGVPVDQQAGVASGGEPAPQQGQRPAKRPRLQPLPEPSPTAKRLAALGRRLLRPEAFHTAARSPGNSVTEGARLGGVGLPGGSAGVAAPAQAVEARAEAGEEGTELVVVGGGGSPQEGTSPQALAASGTAALPAAAAGSMAAPPVAAVGSTAALPAAAVRSTAAVRGGAVAGGGEAASPSQESPPEQPTKAERARVKELVKQLQRSNIQGGVRAVHAAAMLLHSPLLLLLRLQTGLAVRVSGSARRSWILPGCSHGGRVLAGVARAAAGCGGTAPRGLLAGGRAHGCLLGGPAT